MNTTLSAKVSGLSHKEGVPDLMSVTPFLVFERCLGHLNMSVCTGSEKE